MIRHQLAHGVIHVCKGSDLGRAQDDIVVAAFGRYAPVASGIELIMQHTHAYIFLSLSLSLSIYIYRGIPALDVALLAQIGGRALARGQLLCCCL